MPHRAVYFTDPETGKKRRGIKSYRKTRLGEWHNPERLSGAAVDSLVIDRKRSLYAGICLRADSVPGISSIQPLANDQQLSDVCEASAIIATIVAVDSLASPNQAPHRHEPSFPLVRSAEGVILGASSTRIDGENLPSRQVINPQAPVAYDDLADIGFNVPNSLIPVLLASPPEHDDVLVGERGNQPMVTLEREVVLGWRKVKLSYRVNRYQHWADCIADAIASAGLVRSE